MKKQSKSEGKPITVKGAPRLNVAVIGGLLVFSGAISAMIIGSQDLQFSQYTDIVRDISRQTGLTSHIFHDLFLSINPTYSPRPVPIADIASIIEYIQRDDIDNSTIIPAHIEKIVAVEEVATGPEPVVAAPQELVVEESRSQADIVAWMLDHGAVFSNIELVEYEGIADHRGIHAKTDISPDETIMSVPEMFIITRQRALESEIGQKILKIIPSYSERGNANLAISLFLVHERSLGSASFWHKYIQTLPRRFENMPVNYNEVEAKLASDSRLGTMSETDIEIFKADYDLICESLPEFCQVNSFDDYKWGRLAVRSRSFSLLVDGIDEAAMMPFADMVNHDFNNLASWRFEDNIRHGQIFCRRPITKGAPITITYGPKSNRVLLRTYGFAVQDNPFNTANLYIQLPDGEGPSGLLTRRVAKTGNPDTEFYRILHTVSLDTNDDDFKAAIALCRIAVATPDQLDQITDYAASPISLKNEGDALRYMEYEIDAALYKIGETDDDTVLKSSTLSDNERNVLITKHGERDVLMKLSMVIESLLPLVDPSISMAEFTKRRYHSRYANHIAYIRKIVELRRTHLE